MSTPLASTRVSVRPSCRPGQRNDPDWLAPDASAKRGAPQRADRRRRPSEDNAEVLENVTPAVPPTRPFNTARIGSKRRKKQNPGMGKTKTKWTSFGHLETTACGGLLSAHYPFGDLEENLNLCRRRSLPRLLEQINGLEELRNSRLLVVGEGGVVAQRFQEFDGRSGDGIEAVLITNVGAQCIRNPHRNHTGQPLKLRHAALATPREPVTRAEHGSRSFAPREPEKQAYEDEKRRGRRPPPSRRDTERTKPDRQCRGLVLESLELSEASCGGQSSLTALKKASQRHQIILVGPSGTKSIPRAPKSLKSFCVGLPPAAAKALRTEEFEGLISICSPVSASSKVTKPTFGSRSSPGSKTGIATRSWRRPATESALL